MVFKSPTFTLAILYIKQKHVFLLIIASTNLYEGELLIYFPSCGPTTDFIKSQNKEQYLFILIILTKKPLTKKLIFTMFKKKKKTHYEFS